MIIAALRRTFSDLFAPYMLWTLIKALMLSVLGFAAVWGGAWWLIMSSRWADSGWVNNTLHALGETAVIAISLLLFPSVFGVVQALFLDGVADRVEARHYPDLGPPRGTAILDGLLVAVKVLLLMVVVNLVMLPVYIVGSIFFGAGMMLYYLVNGWLCGREFFAQVALRRMTRADTKRWARAHGWTIWMTGTLIVLMGTVPVLNLAAPVVGCALMVHVARALRPPLP